MDEIEQLELGERVWAEIYRLPWHIEFGPVEMRVISASDHIMLCVPHLEARWEDALSYLVSALNRDGRLQTDPEVIQAIAWTIAGGDAGEPQ